MGVCHRRVQSEVDPAREEHGAHGSVRTVVPVATAVRHVRTRSEEGLERVDVAGYACMVYIGGRVQCATRI